MATTPQEGIMALPETDEATTPQISLQDSYGAAKQGLGEVDPQYSAMYDDEMAKAMPALLALSDEDLDLLLEMVQYLQENPEEYAQRIQELEQAGVMEKGDFPAEYDENFLAVFGAAVLEAQKNNEPATTQQPMQPPMAMARGGIAEAARMVASSGRNGDTMLAHITPEEAMLLKKRGGSGTINPKTGLREYFLKKAFKAVTGAVSGAVKAVGGAVKSVLASPIGRIAATVALAAFIGPAAFGLSGAAGAAAQFGLASAGITALGGGNLKDVVKAGTIGAVTGYGSAALGPAIGGSVGVTSTAGQAALGAGVTGAGVNLAQGRSISDSVKAGLTSAAIAGTMTAMNDNGMSRGTGTQDPNAVPVSDAVAKTPQQIQAEIAQGATQPVPAVQPPVAGPVAQGAPSADPLGEFIAQNEALRTAANTPVPKPTPTFLDKTLDYLSPSARAEAGADNAMKTVTSKYGVTQDQVLNAPANSVLGKAYSAATPGVLSNYGPAIGAGLGITALAGGFNAKPAAAPQFSESNKNVISGKATQDLITADPRKYITQNMPGVSYDTAGNITGSSAWTPRSGAGTTEVAGSYLPFSQTYTPPPTYTAPTAAIGGGLQMAQPYNTAQMYDFRPRYAAQGGMMETAGAFPANPLTMSNPAMAMHAQQMPMNTSGVPMNMPMGFAMGGMPPAGIATLAPGGYPRRTGQISGPGTETSDDIPAMLSDGEFVMTAKAVKGLGGGSRRAGAKKMYSLMHRLEKNAARG
jgi:hypothetical protein